VLLIEAIAPLLLITSRGRGLPRLAGVAGLLGLHLGIAAFMRIGIFPLVSIVAVLPFVPSELWTRLRVRSRADAPAPAPAGGRLAGALCLACLAGVLAQDAMTLSARGTRLMTPVRAAVASLGLQHRWDMFAPNPPRTRDELFVRIDGGESRRLHASNARWRKYHEHLGRELDGRSLLRLVCASAPEGARLELVRVRHRIGAATPPAETVVAVKICREPSRRQPAVVASR
jgi:hypothetical protein